MVSVSAISIDVDSLRLYRDIHGLDPDEAGPDPVYDLAVPRFFELLAEVGVPATLFLIGRDAAPRAAVFRPAAGLGAEIASHSFAHDYRLGALPPADIRADLARADAALRPLAPGGRIEGFRAPGYNVTPALLEAVASLGYSYDASLLPAPHYFAARAAAIVAHRLAGRRSASLVGTLPHWLGPTDPYRASPAAPHRPAPGGRLLEIPMAVEPLTRVPLIGTSWVLLPPRVREVLLRSALARLRVLSFELHAIDLLDRSDPGVPAALAALQPDLRVPFGAKRRALRALFGRLAAEAPVRTLAEIARSGAFDGR